MVGNFVVFKKDYQRVPLLICEQPTDPTVVFFPPDMSEFPWLTSFKRAVANMVT